MEIAILYIAIGALTALHFANRKRISDLESENDHHTCQAMTAATGGSLVSLVQKSVGDTLALVGRVSDKANANEKGLSKLQGKVATLMQEAPASKLTVAYKRTLELDAMNVDILRRLDKLEDSKAATRRKAKTA